ncbi:MAG: hypothetical protein ACTSP7_12450 [Candidatus Heimdallarchaeota archaeon]
MKQKNKMIIGIMLLVSVFSTLVLANSSSVQSAFPEVTGVSHSPTVVYPETTVTVAVTFNNDLNVTGIELFYCAITPEFACHIPTISMTDNGSNTWLGSFVVTETSGVIGYKMEIFTLLSGTLHAPDSLSYLGHSDVIEPSTDSFYFAITLSPPTDQAPLMGWCGVTSSLVVIATAQLIRTRKRK